MDKVFRIARKEFASFFSSPAAFIFLGAFLAVNLFLFFWVETFFAVNIAEVRALFKWMPVLLIFLTGAVTMRLWAEERRAGTLEFLLTLPVRPVTLVLGKFAGCLALVLLALLLTLPLPATVSFMGPLDWGPVIGGYLAAVFLAAAYIAIGLYVSAKSENQIVSLIATVLLCTLFYLLGSDMLTSLFGTRTAEILKLLGTGSRFDSITRGVIDLRDLYYYASIAAAFLSLNVLALERMRWAGNPANRVHRAWKAAIGVIVANFMVANFWLAPVGALRADLTQGNIYSISETTRNYLRQLKEPLLIRGYFSAQTHPLLAPLVPQLQDLLREYAIAGGGRVTVEFVDPLEHPELEREAGEKYGIHPVPFQTASKYQAAVTNSYFDVVIQYGDQFETLGFRELIEVKLKGESDLEVELHNPEYDITRAIRKTLYSYQGEGELFAQIGNPVTFTGYISATAALPQVLAELKGELESLLQQLETRGGGLFSHQIVDPEAAGGGLARQLEQEMGFMPMAASLFDQRHFWFYMMLRSGDQQVEVPLPQELDREGLQRAMEAALKRFASGFSRTVALHTQPVTPPMPQYGLPPRGKQFSLLREVLEEQHVVIDTDLAQGSVPEQADLLVLASPERLDDRQLFAVDQFLMRGGTVILATSPYDIELQQELALVEMQSGLEDWLAHHGIELRRELVLDAQNSPFPIPGRRDVGGGFTVQETRMLDYPFFVDIRPHGMNQDSPIMQGVSQITLNWASPISVAENVDGRKITPLLHSSEQSWLTTALEVQPDFQAFPQFGFSWSEEAGAQLLGVAVEGSFTSYFKGKPSPLLQQKQDDGAPAEQEGAAPPAEEKQVVGRVIEKSPGSARIICFSSNTFLSDAILGLGSGVRRTGYLEPVQMVANAADWSLDDSGLVEMRGRSHFSRPLYPLGRDGQMVFEYLNYGLALIALLLVWMVRQVVKRKAVFNQHRLLQPIRGRNR